ncbi:hypothetical protein FA13DRAFT_815322 [Coprinellus micaceus]|uniref:Uncharacterized protein n=1 Tax=Coprinellus micaceus TaxID=71717 RepID=A0A4Y7T1Y7_COPMI|nr:hypothetical protein FA13DRAFT_815322 [Coprinellus micaceus]
MALRTADVDVGVDSIRSVTRIATRTDLYESERLGRNMTRSRDECSASPVLGYPVASAIRDEGGRWGAPSPRLQSPQYRIRSECSVRILALGDILRRIDRCNLKINLPRNRCECCETRIGSACGLDVEIPIWLKIQAFLSHLALISRSRQDFHRDSSAAYR